MARTRAVHVPEKGADFELIERETPSPGPGEVRVRVDACGICHSDLFTKEGLFPGVSLPRVPGHEVVGHIDALGEGVRGWKEGERVGVGWHGSHCFVCDACREGDFILCENADITGVTRDGGYADFMVARAEALARMPESLDATEAAPLMCAGVTVYNALRHSVARPGDLVAVQGVGGLGHLAIQYAHRFGYRTVAVSGSGSKESLARELGAHHYLDASKKDPAEALTEMGGARVVLATAPSAEAMTQMLGGLGRGGQLLVVGADAEPLQVSPFALLPKRASVRGWPSGTARDSQDALEFSDLTGTRTMVETYPLEKAAEAYQRMLNNEVRFRAVLTMG
jgi:D-arabinose 1-dehydrogenase-like Zn-dependent alcohol dehydrogenase